MVAGLLLTGIALWKGWFLGPPKPVRISHAGGAVSVAKIQELRRALREQQEVVAESQKILDNIIRAKGVTYQGEDGTADVGADHQEEVVSTADRDLIEIERAINGLRYLEGDAWVRHAAEVVVPDNPVAVWYPEWLAVRHIVAPNRVERRRVNERLAAMTQSLNEEVEELIRRLEEMKAAASVRLSGLDAQQGHPVYRNAKSKYEAACELLDWMSRKLQRMEGLSVSLQAGRTVAALCERRANGSPLMPSVTDRRYNALHGQRLSQTAATSQSWAMTVTDRRDALQRILTRYPLI